MRTTEEKARGTGSPVRAVIPGYSQKGEETGHPWKVSNGTTVTFEIVSGNVWK